MDLVRRLAPSHVLACRDGSRSYPVLSVGSRPSERRNRKELEVDENSRALSTHLALRFGLTI